MKNDPFENKLHSLTNSLQRVDPTPAWKTEILARARREAMAVPVNRIHVPRWQVYALAAAWIAIFALRFTVSPDPVSDRDHLAGAHSSGYSAGGLVPMGCAYLLATKEYRKLTEKLPL